MAQTGQQAAPAPQTSDEEIYAPPDQSLFDFSTNFTDRAVDRRKHEKEQLAHQQHVIVLIAGIVLAVLLAGGIVFAVIAKMNG